MLPRLISVSARGDELDEEEMLGEDIAQIEQGTLAKLFADLAALLAVSSLLVDLLQADGGPVARSSSSSTTRTITAIAPVLGIGIGIGVDPAPTTE